METFLCRLLKTRPKNEAQLPFLEHHSKEQAGAKEEDYLINLVAYGPHYLVSVFLRGILQAWVYLGNIPELHLSLPAQKAIWPWRRDFGFPESSFVCLAYNMWKGREGMFCSVLFFPFLQCDPSIMSLKRKGWTCLHFTGILVFGLVWVFFGPSLVLHTCKCKKARPGDTVRWLSILPPVCHVNLNHVRENLI